MRFLREACGARLARLAAKLVNTFLLLDAAASAGLVVGLGRLLSKPLPEEMSTGFETKIENLLPSHSQHLPQLRQSLASTDTRYVRRNTSLEAEHMWREERRQIVARFLRGVAADFARTEQFAKVVASLTPNPSIRNEVFRAWLRFRFRASYRLFSRWITAGKPLSIGPLIHLTNLVANLSAYAENAMEQLELPEANS
jgi:hypothetical protein